MSYLDLLGPFRAYLGLDIWAPVGTLVAPAKAIEAPCWIPWASKNPAVALRDPSGLLVTRSRPSEAIEGPSMFRNSGAFGRPWSSY